MSVLDNVIKMRALEQDQNNQMVDSLIKGMTLAQERQKTDLLGGIEQQKANDELYKSGLMRSPDGTVVPVTPSMLTSIQESKKAPDSELDTSLKEARLANTKAQTEAKQLQDSVANPKPVSAFNSPDEWLGQFDQATQQNIKDMVNYDMSAKDISNRTGVGRRSMEGIAGMYAQATGSPYNPATAEQAYSYKQNWVDTKSVQRQTILAANKLSAHLDELGQYGDTLKNTPNQYWNAMKNYAATKLGYPSTIGPEQAQMAVADEMEKALTGIGATQEALTARRKAFNIGHASPAQMDTYIKSNMQIMKDIIDTQANDYTGVVGKPPPLESYYNKKTMTMFKKYGLMGDTNSGSATGGSASSGTGIKILKIYPKGE